MKECVTVSTIIEPTINRGLDVGLHGRTHRDGPQFHLGFGEWQEGSLYPQPGSDRRRFRYDGFAVDVADLSLKRPCYCSVCAACAASPASAVGVVWTRAASTIAGD